MKQFMSKYFSKHGKILMVVALTCILAMSGVLIASISTDNIGKKINATNQLREYETLMSQTVQSIENTVQLKSATSGELLDAIQNTSSIDLQDLTNSFNELMTKGDENYAIDNEMLKTFLWS